MQSNRNGLKGPLGTLRQRKGTGSLGGHSQPEAWGSEGISPCSTLRRVTSSAGRKTFILDRTGSRLGVATPRKLSPVF